MNRERREKPTEKKRQEESGEQPKKSAKKGNGTVVGFQIVLSCLLIVSAVVLKNSFPPEYEEVRRRYDFLLNEEVSFGNFGRYIAEFLRVDDRVDAPDPESFSPSADSPEIPVVEEEEGVVMPPDESSGGGVAG